MRLHFQEGLRGVPEGQAEPTIFRLGAEDGRSGATGMGGSSVDYQDRSDSEEERVTQQMALTLF